MAYRKFSTPKPCIFFAKGKCMNGASCRFTHSTQSQTVFGPCKFYQRGACTNKQCPFSHVSQNATGDLHGPDSHGVFQSTICHYFLRGSSTKGEQCSHFHPGTDALTLHRPAGERRPTVGSVVASGLVWPDARLLIPPLALDPQ